MVTVPRAVSTVRSGIASVRPRPPARGCAGATGDPAAALDGLLDLAALEAARADVRAARGAAQQHSDALEVRVEAPLRRHHRVRPVVAERRLLPANGADLGHGRAV